MKIDTSIIQKLLDSEVTGYAIETQTGVRRTVISSYRTGKAKLDNMTLGMAYKLQEFAKKEGGQKND